MQAGGSRLGSLLLLLVISWGVYVGLDYLPALMAHRAIKDQMLELAKNAQVISDEEIANQLVATASEWSLPIDREDISIEREDHRIRIGTQWVVTIPLMGRWYQHHMAFAPAVDELVLPLGGAGPGRQG